MSNTSLKPPSLLTSTVSSSMDYNYSTACYSFNQHSTYEEIVSSKFLVYSSLIFFVVGLVGNSLSILVFSSHDMRTMSCHIYLLVLAISDSMYLVSILLSKVISGLNCIHGWGLTDVYNHSTAGCRLLQFLLDLFSDYSTCLILVFTIERFLAVYKPMRHMGKLNAPRSKVICLGVFVVIAASTLPHHVLYMDTNLGYKVCTINPQHEHAFFGLYVTEMVVFRIIPVSIIAVFNGLIIHKVVDLSKTRHSVHDKTFQITIIVILISTTYILTIVPMLVTFILERLSRTGHLTLSRTSTILMDNYTSALYICGYSINFFLYTLSGNLFREKLISKLCPTKIPVKSSEGNTSYTEIPLEQIAKV